MEERIRAIIEEFAQTKGGLRFGPQKPAYAQTNDLVAFVGVYQGSGDSLDVCVSLFPFTVPFNDAVGIPISVRDAQGRLVYTGETRFTGARVIRNIPPQEYTAYIHTEPVSEKVDPKYVVVSTVNQT